MTRSEGLLEGTLGVAGPGYYGNVSHMWDAGQSLATETVCCYGVKVLKAAQLAGRETLTHNIHVVFLYRKTTTFHCETFFSLGQEQKYSDFLESLNKGKVPYCVRLRV